MKTIKGFIKKYGPVAEALLKHYDNNLQEAAEAMICRHFYRWHDKESFIKYLSNIVAYPEDHFDHYYFILEVDGKSYIFGQKGVIFSGIRKYYGD
jgi:hypothetical protein